MNRNSIVYIFLTFLKLGSTAFGGYMSLIAMVQKQLVEVDKRLREEELLNAVSLTGILPGPVAVNTIACVGYALRGLAGAAAAFVGIILPSFLLVLVLSKLYFTWGDAPVVKHFFAGIVPALTALIINVAYGMARKTLKYPELTALCIASALALIVIGGYATTLLVMVIGGVMGLGCRQNEAADPLRPSEASAEVSPEVSPESAQTVSTRFRLDASMRRCLLWIGALALLIILIALAGRLPGAPIELQLFSVFSGVSLTLFGGGYVVIPALHELFVDNLQWLTEPEFADGIAIGQVTPGPIFITATFIGYKVAGLTGALLATIGIFTPPALLTVCLTSFVDTLSKSPAVKAILMGVRAAVVGLIFASAYTIGRTADPTWVSALLFGGTLIATFKYNLNPIYIILGSGVAGALLM